MITDVFCWSIAPKVLWHHFPLSQVSLRTSYRSKEVVEIHFSCPPLLTHPFTYSGTMTYFLCKLWSCKYLDCLTVTKWRPGVVAVTTVQLHLTKCEPRSCAGSNPVRDISKDLQLWEPLTTVLAGNKANVFRQSTIPQK